MADNKDMKYIPGDYEKKRPEPAALASEFISEWGLKQLEQDEKESKLELPPTICFSRKIGVGALEIADILGEKIGYRVVDRELLRYITDQTKLSEETITFFDERFPEKTFSKIAFVKSDYTKHLVNAVFILAYSEPTIFVGRGAHLILPRDRVLAVRFISSKEHRAKRLARILAVKEGVALSKLEELDIEQRDFYSNVYGKKGASPYEFDIAINCDYIQEPEYAAEIVDQVFKKKFNL